jgi:hypothetical protein
VACLFISAAIFARFFMAGWTVDAHRMWGLVGQIGATANFRTKAEQTTGLGACET